MILPDDSATQIAECATCPECDRVLVLGHLPPESKRPFVQGRAQGWVLVCRGCGWNHLVEQYLLGRDGLAGATGTGQAADGATGIRRRRGAAE